MGNKGEKGAKPVSKKLEKLSSIDYKFLTTQTGMTKASIDDLFNKFNSNNPDGVLDKQEFTKP